MNGVINLLKPAGMTSHDCVYALRRISGEKRIGHTGTLDPNACGVLPICIGSATRLIEYMEIYPKAYRCEMILGLSTDTQDIWGTVLSHRRDAAKDISEASVRAALAGFCGKINQIPPRYSAVKVDGKRLYQYAREGLAVKVDPRIVTVHRITFLNFNSITGRLMFEAECSKGTYIRTICNDLGDKLGVGGCMSFLLRTSASGLDIRQAATLQELQALTPVEFQASLLPAAIAVKGLERLELNALQAKLFINGNPEFQKGLSKIRQNDNTVVPGPLAVFFEEKLLGIASETESGEYKPVKVLRA
jgi:tRNA pseudouridine55 synthase